MGHEQGFITVDKNRLLIAFGITFLMMVVEFMGGWISGSIALVSDAAHMLVDTLALGASAFASWWASKPNAKKIGAYYVGEVHAALTNGVILVGVAAFIIFSAYSRLLNPHEIRSGLMLAVAIIGLAVNLFGIFLLRHGSRENINVRGAFLHILSDTLSSVGVIAGGIVIYCTGWSLIDPLLGFLIALLILRGGIGLIKDGARILKSKSKAGARPKTMKELKEIGDRHREEIDLIMRLPPVFGVGIDCFLETGEETLCLRVMVKEKADLVRKILAKEISGLKVEVVQREMPRLL